MAKQKRWVDEIIEAIDELGGEVPISKVNDFIEKNTSRVLSPAWKHTVRDAFQHHNNESDKFKNRYNYFYFVGGKGTGIWGLREQYRKKSRIRKTATEEILARYNVSNQDKEKTTRTIREVNQINRNIKIVNALKEHYANTCQICKTRIEIKENQYYSEVHHLKPLGQPHNGPDILENMIVVCPNCHVKLDYKAIQINLHDLSLKAPHKIRTKFIKYQNRV